MRWRFSDPKNRIENAERLAVIAKIDSWWQEFREQASQIADLFSRKAQWDLAEWMGRHLGAIHPGLMWEFGPAVRGNGHRLVITPECSHHLRPLVRTLLERKPVLDNWEFYEYRLAEDLEVARLSAEARTGYDITDFKAIVCCNELQLVDLKFVSSTIADDEATAASNAAFVATECLLGEQCLDTWIGEIDSGSIPRTQQFQSQSGESAPTHFLGLDRLNETVLALIGSMREQLPPSPHYEWLDGAEWTMWKLNPEEADDYCAQKDLFVGNSANPTQWKAAHSGGLFCSERFSRCREMFCYVKVDGSQGLDENGFADRSEIEDALDLVLRTNRLGCHIGGGTGLRYSYIDLALTDVDEGIRATRQRLQAGRIPKRAWIQFFDSDLAAEWVGVYDDTPPPPIKLA